ncbi:hypothetical protein GRQ65_21465 [Nocardioides sp. YIM 123512]|uniref:Cobyrinic acid a,c-diamide synthase n=1 Tax=Nocardioides flavescens TaxID=2691959 RepID=A0A6L7F4E6_9ACTN|nr:hypothetical protein [Nocardioides flavescens]
MSLPSADDLFRPTEGVDEEAAAPGGPGKATTRSTSRSGARTDRPVHAVPDEPPAADPEPQAKRGPSGRIKHDEKVTVYVTSGELLEIEQARLTLRGAHGLSVDRGRLVREALHLVLADLEARGAESDLVRRLREEG